MKIITGSAKGMNLETLDGDSTRPTLQRVKEAVFSMIQFSVENAMVLDLFAGSGQLGLEALSRGAKKAIFSDSSRDATDVIIRNAKKTKLFERCMVTTCDYNQVIRGIAGKEKFDIVFIDPPYKDKITFEIIEKLIKAEVLNDDCLIVCESGEELAFDDRNEILDCIEVYRQSKYSISYITVLKKKATV